MNEEISQLGKDLRAIREEILEEERNLHRTDDNEKPLDLEAIEARLGEGFDWPEDYDADGGNCLGDIAALVAEVKRLRSKYEGPFPRFDDAKVGEVFGLSFLVKGELEPMYIPGEDES